MNQHTLFDAIFRQQLLGISRRYIQHALTNSPEFNLFRISKTIPLKPIVRSFRPKYPFEHWQMDFIDLNSGTIGYHNKGYRHVLVIIDIFTKFVYLKATKKNDSQTVAGVLHSIFLAGDVPRVLHSDNGPGFVSMVASSETSPITLPLRDAVRVKNFEDAAAEWGQKGDCSMAQQFQDEADALRPVVIAARNLHEFATKALKNAHVVLAAAKAENKCTLQGSRSSEIFK